MFCPFYAVQTLMFFLWVPNLILYSSWAQFICSVLFLWTRFMFCPLHVDQRIFRFFSRDVTVWLFRLYWTLFPEMSQLVISSLLEDIQMYFVLSSCTTVSLVDSSPEMLPPGYFVSTGPCFQRCPNWLFRLCWRIPNVFCARLVHHSLP